MAGISVETDPRKVLHQRRMWAGVLAASVVCAAYVGFRMPSLWTATHTHISWGDGTWRRALVGTLIAPIRVLGGHRYVVSAAVGFVVLAGLLIVVLRAALRAPSESQRVLVALWLLGPTGGFLFHEIGYFEQGIYLLLFWSMRLWGRTAPWVAVLPIAAAPLVHEIALATAAPVFAWFVLHRGIQERERASLLLPFATSVLVVVAPPMSEQAIGRMFARVTGRVDFEVRPEVFQLFGRSAADNFDAELLGRGLDLVTPFLVVIVLFWVVAWSTRSLARPRRPLVGVAAMAACVGPFGLVATAWDYNRWIFLGLSNFVLVLFLMLGSEPAPHPLPAETAQESRPTRVIAGVAVVLSLAVYSPIYYFDNVRPRGLLPTQIKASFTNPTFFDEPEL